MPNDVNKIDSNLTGLSFAEEDSLKVLPGTPVWYELEPNSYSDFGGDISTVARAPINPSRQRKKGTVTDLDSSGGFNTDVTNTNLTRLMQGFFFADAREKPNSLPLNGTVVPLTAIAVDSFDAASGLDAFLVGHLIKASNMSESVNDGLALLTAVSAISLTTDKALVVEVPSADAFIEAVGFQFPTSDIDIEATVSSIRLTSTLTDFTLLGMTIGEWVFVGGDLALNAFTNNSQGYARIKSIAVNSLDFDDTTWVPVTEVGVGLDIRIFFGTVIRNEKTPSLIKRRSYNLERQLGDDGNGMQSEYLEGAIPNEYTLNMPQADKLMADLTFIAMDNTQRNGILGIKSGPRVGIKNESAINTSSDLYRVKMNIIDPLALNPASLFAYVSEATIVINNNVSENKALGVLGSFDATAGDFEVGGSITAYFSTVESIAAVRNISDVSFNVITAMNNASLIMDMPLITLGGGRLNVEKDSPINIPLDNTAVECPAGYTMLMTNLSYVPDAGMPD